MAGSPYGTSTHYADPMAARLPPDARWRYERRARRRVTDRWAFLFVMIAVLCAIGFVGDQGVLSLQWITTLPGSLGFAMNSGPPVRRYQGHAAPLFAPSPEDIQDDR